MTDQEIDEFCHTLSIEEVSRHLACFQSYLQRYFGFHPVAAAQRTPEFIAGASRRLEGRTEPCCACGNQYPRADLQFRGEIYCPGCRKPPKER